MKTLSPPTKIQKSTKIQKELLPKLFSGEYGAEITTLLVAGSQVVHSSFCDGDLKSFVIQSSDRELPKISTMVYTVGERPKKRAALVHRMTYRMFRTIR
jgi:hypothetical protein